MAGATGNMAGAKDQEPVNTFITGILIEKPAGSELVPGTLSPAPRELSAGIGARHRCPNKMM